MDNQTVSLPVAVPQTSTTVTITQALKAEREGGSYLLRGEPRVSRGMGWRPIHTEIFRCGEGPEYLEVDARLWKIPRYSATKRAEWVLEAWRVRGTPRHWLLTVRCATPEEVAALDDWEEKWDALEEEEWDDGEEWDALEEEEEEYEPWVEEILLP